MEDSENTLTRSSELVVGMLVVAFVVFVLWVVLLRPTESPKPRIGSDSTATSTAVPRTTIKGPDEAWEKVIATPTPVIPPTPTTTPRPPPNPTATIYAVQPGDTLSAIATRYDVTVDDLVRVNRIVNPDALQVGQDLTIPTPSAPQ